jgi:hypothetical protein
MTKTYDIDQAVRAHAANEAKFTQLIKDAQRMAGASSDKAYWEGVEFGLRRGLAVIQGRG